MGRPCASVRDGGRRARSSGGAARRRTVGAAAAAAAFALVVGARADECKALRIADEGATLPDAWRQALDALAEATSQEGKPWSCVGGEASLVLDADGGGGTLRLETASLHAVERHVTTPDDVLPTGKALLAAPLPPAPRATSPPPDAPEQSARPPAPAHAPPAEGRSGLLVDASAGTGYTGPTRALWAGGTLRGALRYGPWFGGIWARFDVPYHYLSPVPPAFLMSEVSIGLTAARELVREPFVIYLALQPSIAVVSMEQGEQKQSTTATGVEVSVAEGARVDPRVGGEVGARIPLSGVWQAILAVDAELAPLGFRSDSARRIDPRLPVLPAYALGLSIGVGLAIR